MAKCLIVGADGFIGKHLVRELLSADHSVRAFDRFRGYADGESHEFEHLKGVEIFSGDFLNRSDLQKALDGIEYVFHLVSTTNPFTSSTDPYIDLDTNVRGSIELLELCTLNSSVKKVIFSSTGGAIYGEQKQELLDEGLPPKPQSPYAIGKLTIENYLRYFNKTHGLQYIVYRIANPYGEGQNIHAKQGVIPIFLNNILQSKPVTVFGDGSMVRDYLYVDDLVKMIAGSFEKPNKFDTYNLGSGSGQSVNELISAIEATIGKSVDRQTVEIPSTFIHKSVLDTERFQSEFGIRATTNLTEGIKRTWDYTEEAPTKTK